MSDLNFESVHPVARERIEPFLREVTAAAPVAIRAVYVTGSAVTADFNPPTSDVNSLIVAAEIRADFLDLLAELGRKAGKRGVRAPLLMTPAYIERSLDVFPVEFLDLQKASHLVTGDDLLAGLAVDAGDARLQCERELKGRLITLRQGYIRSLGDRRLLRTLLVDSLSGIVPLLRGVLFAMGKPAPADHAGILAGLREAALPDTAPIEAVVGVKRERRKPGTEEIRSLFHNYYEALRALADAVDAVH